MKSIFFDKTAPEYPTVKSKCLRNTQINRKYVKNIISFRRFLHVIFPRHDDL